MNILSLDTKKINKKIIVGLILGVLCGLAIHYFEMPALARISHTLSAFFIRFLKMIIVPLVFSSVFMAVVHLGGPKDLGKLGVKTLLYYFFTTALAVLIGLLLVNIIHPGLGVDLGIKMELSQALNSKLTAQKGLGETILGVLLDMIPSNPIQAFAGGKMLQIIFYALTLGLISLYIERSKIVTVINFVSGVETISFALTTLMLLLLPYGIFFLVLKVVSSAGLAIFYPVLKYVFVVIAGLFIHGCILLLFCKTMAKKSFREILQKVSSPLLTAFSTASSAATLPITMNAAKELGVREKISRFTLPLGATINMDGTALYESVAVVFIAEVYGIDLSFAQQIIIFVTASLAAVGAAAIPGAGLITMSIVLSAVGLPLDGIGLILAVDRFLDMFRTTVNVFGDLSGALVIDRCVAEPAD